MIVMIRNSKIFIDIEYIYNQMLYRAHFVIGFLFLSVHICIHLYSADVQIRLLLLNDSSLIAYCQALLIAILHKKRHEKLKIIQQNHLYHILSVTGITRLV